MMRWLVGSSLRSRRVVIALAALGMVFGFLQLRDMPRDVLPEFTPPTVEVQTEALGLSAAEVEEFITVPLEQDLLNGVAFLETIRSESMPGLSSIEMIFEPGTDILDARQVVAERLTQAHALPQVSKPPHMLQPISSTNRVMMVGLSSDDLSRIDQSILARWMIRPRLMGVQGVAEVSIWGLRERQLQVLVNPDRLHANGVTLQQVIKTAGNAQFVCPLTYLQCSTPGPGGIIETFTNRLGTHVPPPFKTPEDLASVPIAGTDGLLLGDVADVVEGHQLLIGDAVSREGAGLTLIIEKFPQADAAEVVQGVDSALEALRPGLSKLQMDPTLFRPTTYLETSDQNLTTALIIGSLLLLLALGAVLFDWRTALVSLVAIVASLLAAGLVLSRFDVTLNSMIIAGLVLSLVVVIDDAIGAANGIRQRLGRGRKSSDSASVARRMMDALIGLRSAALYGTLISVIAFVPVFFTQGPFGAFFPSIAVAYAVAVATSMIVSLIVTPAVAGLVMARAPEPRESPVVRWLRPRYDRALARVTRPLGPAIIVAAVLLVLGLVAVPFIGWSLTPEFKDSSMVVRLEGPPGTSLTEMNRVTSLILDELEKEPGILNVGGTAGRALVSDRVVNTNSSELWVSLDPAADHELTKGAIEEVVAGFPGLSRSVSTYPGLRIDEVLTESRNPITVRVFGQDFEVMQRKADEVRRLLAEVEGVENPRVESQIAEPILEVTPDLEKADQYQLVPGDIRRSAVILLSGLQVGSLFDEQKVFEVVVWGTPNVRHDLSSIENLSIDTPNGEQVRLGDVASVRVTDSPTVIRHDSVSRSLDVTADVAGRDLSAIEADVKSGLREIDFPIEYHAELMTDFAQAQAVDREAMWFAVAAAIAIFLLLQSGVGSWRLSAVLFLMLPLSLAGAATAVLLTGREISFGSVAASLAVLGMAARLAVMQVKHVQDIERREGEAFGPELVRRGARERFTPLLASLVTTLVILAPLAIVGPIAGLEIIQPMAVALLGGVVSTALFALFIVPMLHGRFGSSYEEDVSLVMEEERTIDITEPQDAQLARS